ncbi:MAG TPA: sugar phosphate nucleotidyltransferase, partial [Bdellovibrionota bacterium]|nr:sugar phosphate nucleotidyltransferase [Bdellovibrionota bacterium]
MKGMILAAGLGTRLLPLTQFIPKPLLPILNTPMLRYCLELFHHFGIQDVTINTHHLNDQINRFLEEMKGFSFQISHESIILGSFGGVRKMWDLIGHEPIISMNSDIVTTLDLHALINAHREKLSLITIGLIPGRGEGTYTNVWVGKDGRILSVGGEAPKPEALRTHYCGIQILEPPIKDWLESGQYGELNPVVFQRALTEKIPFYGYVSQSLWYDGGSPTHLLNTNKMLLTLL